MVAMLELLELDMSTCVHAWRQEESEKAWRDLSV